MSARRSTAPSLSRLRSAITNGTTLVHGHDLDHRGAWARRLRDLIAAHTSDLGGDDILSEAERVLVRRAAMLTLQLELMETRFAAAEGEASPKALAEYQRCTNTLRRTLEALGLKRRPRDVTPDPLTYARQHGAA